ncbi:hypothetical protein [Billgrantia montanilacus]|nr:hypothetical protein [Halomonas montanilacus]
MNALWEGRIELDELAAKMRHDGKTEYAQLLEDEAHKLGMVLLQIEGILQDAPEQQATAPGTL